MLDRLRSEWPALVEQCRVAQPLLQHLLRDSWPVSLNDTTLVIGFDPEFASEIEMARGVDRGALHHLFQRHLGHPVHLEYVVLSEPVRWSHRSPHERPPPTVLQPAPNRALDRRTWESVPVIRLVLETFHGDITDIQF